MNATHGGREQSADRSPAEPRSSLYASSSYKIDASPDPSLIHELFEYQALRSPQRLAAVYEAHTLTYFELNSRADQLARTLGEHGIQRDDLVALYVPRGLASLVAILGILKAGAAYVPLDPDLPPDRLGYMLADAAPKVLLTQGRVPAVPHALRTLELDELAPVSPQGAAQLTGERPSRRADDLAYVIYTSGSTGRPKGVMIEHGSVVNLWTALELAVIENASCARVGLNAPLTFDASVQQLVHLLSGRTLFIVPQALRRDAELLVEFIQQHKIETIDCTPSQLKTWLKAGLLDRCARSLRTVIVGGEAIDAPLWTQLARSNDITFYNVYGPTECTVDSTAVRIRDTPDMPNIGTPIRNVNVHILDAAGNPVPHGDSGEIHISGAGVARGYLKRPELTAQRFTEDRAVANHSGRMYRTGDIGRWRPDGKIEFLGRNDDQIKIRGYRVEPGEIEQQLRSHAWVGDVVVVAREDSAGAKRLVAYVVLKKIAGGPPSSVAESLRSHLEGTSPEYMVPAAFVTLESLPMMLNGKVDRSALPDPKTAVHVARDHEEPIGDVEALLAATWQDTLRMERVGRRDHFFELGGHSLLVVEMIERLRRRGFSVTATNVYEQPILADLASAVRARLDQLKPSCSRIPVGASQITPQMLPLVSLNQEHIDAIVSSIPGGAANIEDIYPLAPLQEGTLFHHLLDEKQGCAYVITTVLELSCQQRVQELQDALRKVMTRHDVLRTAVLWEGLPQAVQVVCREVELDVHKLAFSPSSDASSEARRLAQSEEQPIDLQRAPLLRLKVAAGPASQRWYVLLQVHHIISDNVTHSLLLNELSAHLDGRAADLPAPGAYRDHVVQVIDSARRADDEKFFRDRLGDVIEPTVCFGLSAAGASAVPACPARATLEQTLAARLRTQARQLGVPPAVLFHLGWALVVSHAAARDDVVFGTVLSGRLQGMATQGTMGMFINTLPVRLKLQELSAVAAVSRAQQVLIELLAHEQASLAVALRCSGVAGSTPLFNALLNYQRPGANERRSPTGAAPGLTEIDSFERATYPLVLSVWDDDADLTLEVKAEAPTDPRRVLGSVLTALSSLTQALETSPTIPVLALKVVSDAERHLVLQEFNAGHVVGARDQLIHELFEHQVRKTPRAIAVTCAGESLSFADLDARANRLASYLRRQDVGANRLVAICIERSVDVMVAMLGVLKAGGAYLPLDPNYPEAWLMSVLDDAAPIVVLAKERQRASLGAISIPIVSLDGECDVVTECSHLNLDNRSQGSSARDLAYVIYTSGSTGRPKGVAIEHRNVISLLESLERIYSTAPDCRRVGVNASINFDASVKQYIQLLSGRTLVIIPAEIRSDPPRLLQFIAENDVHVMDCTPSQLETWVAAGLLDSGLAAPRMVLVGGEPIGADLWRKLTECSNIAFINVYGPTECTVDATAAPIRGDSKPHIGRPIANTSMYVLDSRGRPVSIGVTGEIYIGGAGVARGYLNRPQLTAERFPPDPFASDAGARMYKSGDTGRWRADGTVEYFGRADGQVKVRGYRVELGEIEARLRQNEWVREAVVIGRERRAGEMRLVAYVTHAEGFQPDPHALRRQLSSALPDYMMPSDVVILDRLPLTPGGKLDRRALPDPVQHLEVSRHEAPSGEVELALAKIWESILQVDRVGRHDSFFDLGGHSLLAMQVIVRIRALFSIDMPMKTLFTARHLSALAAVVDQELKQRLLDEIEDEQGDIEAVIKMVASMSEADVRERMKDLLNRGTS